MKKIFTLFAALAMVMSMSAAPYLKGSFNDWGGGNPLSSGSTTITLGANATYTFKVEDNGTWYGNNGTMTSTSCTDWTMSSSDGDCKIKTTIAGVYTFKWNNSSKKLSVVYPTEAVVIDYYIAGDFVTPNWDPGAAANKMDYADGVYSKSYNNVAASAHQFKITNGTWNNAIGYNKNTCSGTNCDVTENGGNIQFTPLTEGTVTITYTLADGKVHITCPEPPVAEFNITYPATQTNYTLVAGPAKAQTSAEVSFTATPAEGYVLNVTYNGNVITGENNVYTFIMPASDVTIAITAVAATTLYYVDHNNWGIVKAYMWDNNGNNGWPGAAMTSVGTVGDKAYSYYSISFAQGAYTNIIFNNGSGSQTDDLTINTAKPYFYDGAWYTWDELLAKLAAPVVYETVYFVNNMNWTKVQAYAWNATGNNGWPGTQLTATGEKVEGFDVYSFEAAQGTYTNLIFNNKEGDAGVQSANYVWTADKYYYMGAADDYAGGTKEEVAALVAPDPLATDVFLAGEMNDWNATANEFKKAAAEATTASVTISLTAKTYMFKIVAGDWLGNKGTMKRDNCAGWTFEKLDGGDETNCKIVADIAGDYTFTWDLTTKKLTVTYPELPTYNVNATVNPAETGSVEGAKEYKQGEQATLTATPAVGYEFVNWTVGETFVTENPYKFTVTADVALVANFAKKVYTVTVTAENGTVKGLAADGKYEHGAEATLTAEPAEGYEFTCWTSGEDTVSTANPYTFTVTANVDLVANFEKAATEVVLENAYKEVYFMFNRAIFFGEHATYGDISVQVNNYNGYGTYAEGVSSRIGDVRVNGSATFENKGETDLLTATLTDAEGTVYIVKAEVPTPKTYEVVATNAAYVNVDQEWSFVLTVNGLTVGEEELTLTVYWDGVGGSEEGYEASAGFEGSIQGMIFVDKGEDDVLSFEGTLKDASDNSYIFNFTATPKASETYTLTFEDMVIEPGQWDDNLHITAENAEYAIEFKLFGGKNKGYGEYGFTDGYPDVDEVYINFEYAQLKEGTVAKYYKNEETGLATIEATFLLGIDTYIVTLTGEPLVNPEDIVPTDTINITMTKGTIGLVYGMVKVAALSEDAELSILLVGEDPYNATTNEFAASSYLVTTAGSLTFLRGGLEIVEVGDVKIAYIGVLCSDHKWYNIVLTTGTEAPTALDNLNSTVAPVKMIENGQLIIIKNGVQYNAQGAVVK